jgi:hypothetical protein
MKIVAERIILPAVYRRFGQKSPLWKIAEARNTPVAKTAKPTDHKVYRILSILIWGT